MTRGRIKSYQVGRASDDLETETRIKREGAKERGRLERIEYTKEDGIYEVGKSSIEYFANEPLDKA